MTSDLDLTSLHVDPSPSKIRDALKGVGVTEQEHARILAAGARAARAEAERVLYRKAHGPDVIPVPGDD